MLTKYFQGNIIKLSYNENLKGVIMDTDGSSKANCLKNGYNISICVRTMSLHNSCK